MVEKIKVIYGILANSAYLKINTSDNMVEDFTLDIIKNTRTKIAILKLSKRSDSNSPSFFYKNSSSLCLSSV
jgi:hypothetical protein